VMAWGKVDDRLYSSPKWLAAKKPARALWVTALSWSMDQLTDGHVPAHVLAVLDGTRAEAADLVRVGLWHTTDDGWVFHDWSDYQPSRAQVLAERAAGAARQKVARSPELRESIRRRDGDRCRYCGSSVRWNDRRGALGGTYDHVIPDG